MVLLERERELAALGSAVAGASVGEGSGVAVTGNSGTGKSALVEAACTDAHDIRVLRGACDPLRTPRPLGPFRGLSDGRQCDLVHTGEETLLAEVCERVYETLRAEPTVLVVEDVHWIDAASVDVLRFLARRVDAMPLALLLTYRDNEIGPRHSARPLLGDFASLEWLTTLQLGPLSMHAVRTLLAGSRLDPERVHAVTGGNPFFVTEVAKDPQRPLPRSVRDAVLARVADVAAEDFEVLQLVSAAPDRLDDRVLPALGVDLPTLRRLDASGLLGRARGGLVFHHELARQAIETTIPPGGGPRLHARLLGALERVGLRDPAVLTHHAVAARDTARAAGYARAAAQEAIEAGSHTEAAAFFETALENLADAPAAERAELLLELAFEQYMTSRLGDAIANVRATFPLWQRSGDPAGLSAAYVSCALFEYYNARRHHAEAHAERAASIAADSGDQLHYGMARSTRALLAYLRSDLDLARACYTDASRIAREVSDDELALRSRLIQDAMALAEGDVDARRRLAQHIEEARAHGWDELASTGYSNLASIDVEQRRYREAGHVLEESLPFTVERDITICRHWQTSVRSRLHFAEGHWSAALEDAEQVLDNQGMPIATLWPYLITCLIPLRRGDEIPAANLDAAWELAEQLDEPVRRLAVMSARAERMWMTEVADPLVTQGAVHALATLGAAPATAWAAGELAVWLNRLGLAEKPPPSAAEPFRLTLEGHFDEAAAWWRRAGEPFAEAVTMGDSSDPRARARGVELLDRLGAIGTADRLRIGLRRDGLTQIPARPRNSTRANPAGLTNRQLDVAKLLARGLTNAEIASRLYISAKTADHHVSAVLTKMGLPNRRSVALHAEELGLI